MLVHAPGLLRYGSKPSRELAKDGGAVLSQMRTRLRRFTDAVSYPPNQVYIGNLAPEELWERPEPWWRHGIGGAPARGPVGEIVPEDAFWGLLRLADEFGLVRVAPDRLDRARDLLRASGLWTDADLERIVKPSGRPANANVSALERADSGTPTGSAGTIPMGSASATPRGAATATPAGVAGAGTPASSADDTLPLYAADGSVAGSVARGYPDDVTQTPDVLLENLACKASGALAIRHLVCQLGLDAREVDYVLGCGEEAVGDRYQRGGGSLSKAMAEMAGCSLSTGSDVKAFCCAPVHALVMAGALVSSGVHRNVVVVGGGSLAKLGMKMLGHLGKDMPLLEDCLAAMAILIGPADGSPVRLRIDAVGKHTVASGGSAGAIYEALVSAPLDRMGLRITDVDKYAVELHNPEITVPAGSGNVPRTNYRTIASLAVRRNELSRDEIDGFERRHGMPGFVPTQGHIPAALPYLAHALPRLRDGTLKRALFIAKGSLFLGKMTNMADGMSVLVDRAD